jgi:hypothetical protein
MAKNENLVKLVKSLYSHSCPSDYGLKDVNRTPGQNGCKHGGLEIPEMCEDCFLKAIQNEEDKQMIFASVKITSGELHPYLKDVILWGFVYEDKLTVHECHERDEEKFYKGILDYDKSNPVHHFGSVEEVKHYWEGYRDMTLRIELSECEEVSEAELDAATIEAARKGQWHPEKDIVERLGGE